MKSVVVDPRRLADVARDWIGALPDDWRLVPLKSCARVFPSNVDKNSIEGEIPVRLCNYTDVYYRELITGDEPLMFATATDEEIRKFTLRAGDTIVTKDSEEASDIGRSAYVPNDLAGVVCGYHLSMIRPTDRVLGAYVKRLFDSEYVRAVLEVSANGLTRVGLGQYSLDNLDIPLPPLSMQRIVLNYLDRETAKIDALIAKQEDLSLSLREWRQTRLIDLVSHGVRSGVRFKPSSLDWVEKVPDDWDIVNIRYVSDMKTGHTPSRSNPDYWVNPTIPWFTLADVWQLRDGRRIYLGETSARISQEGLANSAAELLPAGTVVLSRTASVGFTGIMPEPMATSQDFWNWICGPELIPEYLAMLFRAMQQHFTSLKMGSTHQTIYQGDAAAIKIPLPSVSEQRQIISELTVVTEATDRLLDKSVELVARLREYRSALITAAVTGKVDAREMV